MTLKDSYLIKKLTLKKRETFRENELKDIVDFIINYSSIEMKVFFAYLQLVRSSIHDPQLNENKKEILSCLVSFIELHFDNHRLYGGKKLILHDEIIYKTFKQKILTDSLSNEELEVFLGDAQNYIENIMSKLFENILQEHPLLLDRFFSLVNERYSEVRKVRFNHKDFDYFKGWVEDINMIEEMLSYDFGECGFTKKYTNILMFEVSGMKKEVYKFIEPEIERFVYTKAIELLNQAMINHSKMERR